MSIIDLMINLWQVADNPPPSSCEVDLIVGMALSPTKDGQLGKLNETVLEKCKFNGYIYPNAKFAFSNGVPLAKQDSTIGTAQKEYLLNNAFSEEDILLPKNCLAAGRNSHTEAEFVFELLRLGKVQYGAQANILIITDPLHMRRTLKTFRKLNKDRENLYWISANTLLQYGPDYMQKRFLHPPLFLGYEYGATSYFKMRGWV